MALSKDDLKAIEQIVEKNLKEIKTDLKVMKADVKLLAALNQLDEIKKDSRLRVLYNKEERQKA